MSVRQSKNMGIEEFRENWAKLQSSYLESVGEKIDELQELWESTDQRDMFTLYRMAHNLAGAGGTFGLVELGAIAKELELFIQDIRENSISPDAECDEKFNHFISRLHGAREPSITPKSPLPTTEVDDVTQTQNTLTLIHVDPLNILVAEDDVSSQLQLKLTLEKLGHHVMVANNGKEAVECFQKERPDMVLMDVVMPEMDGFEAAKLIKQQSAPNFIPIIFLTAANDEKTLVKSINAGGDDFLVKPYNHVVLQAKIHALQRIESLNHELQVYKQNTEEEVFLARHLYETIISRNTDSIPGLLRWSESAGHFSGDMVLYRDSPNGLLNVFIADFTGHGMAAALGGMIAADVFHALSEKSGEPLKILTELNRKLNNTLPTGRYCASTLISIDIEKNKVRLWNCGLPPALLKNCSEVKAFTSNNLPLGVLTAQDASFNCYEFDIEHGLCLVVYSDGVSESVDAQGNMYGDDRLQRLVAETSGKGEAVMSAIKNGVMERVNQGGELNDDVTLFIIDL